MELCGNVIQDLAEFLGIQDLPSTGEFPAEIERLMSLVEKVVCFEEAPLCIATELLCPSGERHLRGTGSDVG